LINHLEDRRREFGGVGTIPACRFPRFNRGARMRRLQAIPKRRQSGDPARRLQNIALFAMVLAVAGFWLRALI